MARPYLQPRIGRVELCEVQCVTVSHTGGVQSFPVVVYGHGTVDYLITAVAVYVRYTQVVITLTGKILIARFIRIKGPGVRQILSVPVESGKDGTGIITAAHDYTGMDTVQIGDTCKETIATVGTIIAPASQLISLGNVVDGLQGFSRHAGEYGEVFFSFKDTSLITESRFGCSGISFLLSGSIHLSRFTIVGGGITYDIAFTVYAPVGCTHYYLGLAVIVQIIDHKLCVMGTGTDVLSEVDTP